MDTARRDHRIIEAYLAGDLTVAEIGAELGFNERTVLRVLARARKRGQIIATRFGVYHPPRRLTARRR